MPDVMAQSGARLVEVGTTNRTRLDDYDRRDRCANSADPACARLELQADRDSPNSPRWRSWRHWHANAATARHRRPGQRRAARYGPPMDSITSRWCRKRSGAGFDLAAFSGDKLLGGPQAGIIAGRSELVEKLKRHPLARAVRIDKLSLAALVATLEHYRRGDAVTSIPVWQMIAQHPDTIRARAEAWAMQVGGDVVAAESTIGGGSLPGQSLPTYVLAFDVPRPDLFATQLRRQLIGLCEL